MPATGKAKPKRKRSGTTFVHRKRKRALQRVRTAPKSAPNVYHFTRGYDSFANLGATTGIFAMNNDNTFQIISLKCSLQELPNYTEFNSLFSEYKIKSFSVRMVPTFKTNVPVVLTSADATHAQEVPNYEVFAIPANFTDDEQDFTAMTGTVIDSFLNQTQRKSMLVMPNRSKTYHTSKPKVVKYGGPAVKGAVGTSTLVMGSPNWMSTAAPTGVNQDERAIFHYGLRLLIRRVDGAAMSTTAQTMGFRIHHQVNLMMRKVQ